MDFAETDVLTDTRDLVSEPADNAMPVTWAQDVPQAEWKRRKMSNHFGYLFDENFLMQSRNSKVSDYANLVKITENPYASKDPISEHSKLNHQFGHFVFADLLEMDAFDGLDINSQIVAPLPRETVKSKGENLRNGKLDLFAISSRLDPKITRENASDSIAPSAAQFHFAFQRLMLAIRRELRGTKKGLVFDGESVHRAALRLTRWHYQWLVLNSFLPSFCDQKILTQFGRHQANSSFEFYDLGRSADTKEQLPVPIELLSAMAALDAYSSKDATHTFGGASFVRSVARGQNFHQALLKEARMNVASAQSCLDQLECFTGLKIERISYASVGALDGTDARMAEQFQANTPLCFYLARERAVLGSGERLGPLASWIVLASVTSSIVFDSDSFLNHEGGGKSWSPSDCLDVVRNGPVENLIDLLALAKLM